MTACARWLARDFLRRTARPIDIPPCDHTDCPPIEETAMTATANLRRRVADPDGVVFTEHPSGYWIEEADFNQHLAQTWPTYDQLLADAGELTELEPEQGPDLAVCSVCNGTIQHTGRTVTGWQHEGPVPFEHDAEPRLADPATA